MKRLGFAFLFLFACTEKEISIHQFTGNETVYPLEAGSSYAISGTLTIKEKTDGTSFISIKLTGTEGTLEHPVHLHFGDIGLADATIAALLTPVLGQTGMSETTLSTLADETSIRYEQLLALEACIKIHLASSGPGRDVILAAANIGAAVQSSPNARMGIAVCR